MDVVNYNIFINLLVNHTKIIFVKYRQLFLIFTQVRTAILFRLLFLRYKKFFLFNNIIENCSPNRKTKSNSKKNYKKD